MTGISQKVGNFSEQVWGISVSVVIPEDREDMILPMLYDVLASEDSELWLKYAPLWAEAGRP